MGKKKLRDAYVLAALGFFGLSGIHRFYLGKYVSGFLYFITGGFFGIGTVIDLLNMRNLVDSANQTAYIEDRLDERSHDFSEPDVSRQRMQSQAHSLEHLIFILAKDNNGILSTAQLVIESGLSTEQVQEELESMVTKGHAVQGERSNGLKVYVFQEFLTPDTRTDVIF